MKKMLLVVDMQNGFVNHHSEQVVPNVLRLIDSFSKKGEPVVFTRFFNHANSQWVKLIGWKRLMESPETDLVPAIASAARLVFDKSSYTALTSDVQNYVKQQDVDRIVLCGVATDGCVLKTAVDIFEKGLTPIVVSDACASHAGQEVHEAGLMLIKRYIGKQQVVGLEEMS